MNFQIESATESGSATHLVSFLHMWLHVVRKITAQVINSSTVISSETITEGNLTQCRSGLATRCRSRLRDEVPLVEFLSYELEQKWKTFKLLKDHSGSGKLEVEAAESPFLIITQFTNYTRYCET